MLSRETQLAIADLACARGIRVLSDEMYRLLEYDQVRRLPPMADLLPSALSLSGLSKTIGLPGLRMGWLVTQDRELLKRLATFKDYTTICHNAPSEILAIIGLRNNQALLASRMAIIQRNLALLDTFFSRQSERMSWIRPQAGPVAFPRLETGVPATTFCQRLLDDSGVLLLPGAVFDYPDDHVRIGFGRANMPEALERLEGFVRSGT